ncbi:MAG: ribonuclease R [Planctomycetota bacterium]
MTDTLNERIVRLLKTAGPMKRGQIAAQLGGWINSDRRALRDTLQAMEKSREIIKISKGQYALADDVGDISGKLEVAAGGFGFVIVPGFPGKDIFIPRRALGSAIDGDTVAVELDDRRFKRFYKKDSSAPQTKRDLFREKKRQDMDSRPSGRVVRIIERATDEFVGTFFVFHEGDADGWIEPDSKRMRSYKIIVPKGESGKAKNSDRVVARLVDRDKADYRRSMTATVIEALGESGLAAVEMRAICIANSIRTVFPDEVIAEADAFADEIPESEIKIRADFRNLTTVTIDPVDAKDYDDAVSIVSQPDGHVELYVHIADVSHYVPSGSEIDKEAYLRGTSTYLPGMTVPMLPEKLSNKLCSLRADEDKLTRTVKLEYDADGRYLRASHFRSIIRSNARLNYDGVYHALETGKDAENLKPDVLNLLKEMKRFGLLLRKRRFDGGALDLDSGEVHIILDDDKNEVLEIRLRDSNWAHWIIEEFMLAANRAVAEYTMDAEIASIYRIHEQPDEFALKRLSHFAESVGFSAKQPLTRSKLQKLLDQSRGTPFQNALHFATLTSMKKAIYSSYCQGHFALAFDRYSHFTSPIRRYPDLVTHRQLLKRFDADADKLPPANKATREQKKQRSTETEALAPVADRCSMTERAAETAERDATTYRQLLYIKTHPAPDDEYDGVITRVIEAGFSVMLNESKAEGFVPVETLLDDHYNFDQRRMTLSGRRGRHSYRLGDAIRVRVSDINLSQRTLELEVL